MGCDSLIEIILVSHGDYAKAMLKSAEMIVGEQQGVHVFGLHLGDSVDELREKLAQTIEKVQESGEVLVLTDMFSGSPFNVTFSLMEHYSFQHLTGINLPMLLEILTSRHSGTAKELCQEVLEKGIASIRDVNQIIEEMGQ